MPPIIKAYRGESIAFRNGRGWMSGEEGLDVTMPYPDAEEVEDICGVCEVYIRGPICS